MTATISMTDDREGALISLPNAKPMPITSIMTTAEVEGTLNALGMVRGDLLPAIPDTWDRSLTVRAERDPKWDVWTDMLAGDALLHLRDHHFGWRHSSLTKSEARKLGAALIAQADAPMPSTAGTA